MVWHVIYFAMQGYGVDVFRISNWKNRTGIIYCGRPADGHTQVGHEIAANGISDLCEISYIDALVTNQEHAMPVKNFKNVLRPINEFDTVLWNMHFKLSLIHSSKLNDIQEAYPKNLLFDWLAGYAQRRAGTPT